MKNIFLKKWKKYYLNIFTKMYPEIDKKELKTYLDEIIENNLINPKAKIHNNYIHKSIDVDLLSVIDWLEETKPIIGGFGVFYKNQYQSKNPAANMLKNFLSLRKSYKKLLKKYNEKSYEYGDYDRKQLNEKQNTNSYYGAGGAPTSNFFNLYTATSVTYTGQSLISTTMTAFEAFLSNNVPFINLDDCLNFINNITNEKFEIDDSFLPNITIDKLFKRLKTMFKVYYIEYDEIIINYLNRLSQKEINRLYYKNNLYEFSKLPKIRNKIHKIIKNVKLYDNIDKCSDDELFKIGKEEFRDPNEVPETIKNDLKKLWNYYNEFVLYINFAFDRINRLKYDKRKSVVTVDTDSNMVNLDPWLNFVKNNIIDIDEDLKRRDKNKLKYIIINMMCYNITNMIQNVLKKYCEHSNIPEEFMPNINMKNEFLFSRLILSPVKKRYLSSVVLREGKELNPPKIDVKGHDFVKSSVRIETEQFFKKLVKEKLLYTDNIDISDILRELEEFRNIISKSLLEGEKKFLIPKSVKELEAYKDPYREQGVRGILIWNLLYPDNSISLPQKVDIVKVKLDTKEQLEKLKKINKEFYDKIYKDVFNNKNEKISKKGVQVIAIPRNIPKIPEWIMEFIDYETIILDNISKFYSVLKSLGIETIKASSTVEYHSNILKI